MDSFTELDGNLLIGIQHALNADWLTPVMKGITYLAEDGIFLIAVCLLLLAFRKTRRLGMICALSLAFTFLYCNLIVKPLVGRARPFETFEMVNAMMPHPGDASFPSGHSANSMGPAWAMFLASMPARLRKADGTGSAKDWDSVPCLGWNGVGADPRKVHRISVAAVIMAVLIGFSRIYLGMHYVSDVVCGLLLGMLCAAIVQRAIDAVEKKRGSVFGA
ncbi:MAG: phosphatase PAP2 family protein [Clostridiales bacterium]|nr:phosphatase PAP2 family protein [Clostridiales bacterium]